MNSSEDKIADAAYTTARATVDAGHKIVSAIERNTAEIRSQGNWIWAAMMMLVVVLAASNGCPRAKAAPLVSDGDEITSVGTVQVITPHPSWAPALGGTSWISIAQTGWPLLTWLPNGTVVSFSEAFSLDSMPSAAMVTWAADDSASLWLNGSLVAPEAPTAGNGYSVCSDVAPTCRYHTTADILPWLHVGANVLRFDVAQRGGYSFGLNYAVGLLWLDEPPRLMETPEPGTAWMAVAVMVGMVGYTLTRRMPLRAWYLLWRVRRKLLKARKALGE